MTQQIEQQPLQNCSHLNFYHIHAHIHTIFSTPQIVTNNLSSQQTSKFKRYGVQYNKNIIVVHDMHIRVLHFMKQIILYLKL